MKKIFTSVLLMGTMGLGASAQSGLSVGSLVPNFTFKDTKGNLHTVHSYCDQGKYVMIDMFAYWCGPCQSTAPIIDEFYNKYGCNSGNVVVLAAESDNTCTYANYLSFVSASGIDTNHAPPTSLGGVDSNASAINTGYYNVSAFPTVILIGPDRKLVKNDIWPINNVADIEAAFPAGVLTPMSCTPASIVTNNKINFNVYPNPNKTNTLHIQSNNITNITIADISGKTMISNDYNAVDVVNMDISSVATGVYLVNITTQEGTAVTKFVKEK